MKPIRIAGATALLALAAGGCVKTINSVEVPAKGEVNWVRTDPQLSKVARLTSVRKVRDNGPLEVQVEVANTTDSEQAILYKFIWMDSAGMVVPTPVSVWEHLLLQGRQSKVLTAVAPEPRMTDCRVEMQRAEDR